MLGKKIPKLQGNGWVNKQKKKTEKIYETSIYFVKTEGVGKMLFF